MTADLGLVPDPVLLIAMRSSAIEACILLVLMNIYITKNGDDFFKAIH